MLHCFIHKELVSYKAFGKQPIKVNFPKFGSHFRTGISNSKISEGHIPEKKCSAGRSLLEKAFAGRNLQEKLSK
jgi:hypothetical protein